MNFTPTHGKNTLEPLIFFVFKKKNDPETIAGTVKKDSTTLVKDSAKINSESPAWAFDRLSILALKIYHMNEEATRAEASQEHRDNCQTKLNILLEQRTDLSRAIDDLLQDIENGDKFMKVYKQMKMYNDDDLNPVLYQNKK